MPSTRNYQWNEHSIKVKLRPYGILLWLVFGIEVWVDGRKFSPEFDRLALKTHTDFEIDLKDGSRVTGVAKTLSPMWLLPQVKCSILVGDVTIASEVFTLDKWYLCFIGFLILFSLLTLVLLGMVVVFNYGLIFILR